VGGLPDLQAAMEHHENNWLKIASAIVLLLLIINGYIQRFMNKKDNSGISADKLSMERFTKYKVEGMTCKHCKTTVEKGILELDPAVTVIADPSANELRISSGIIEESAIRSRVESLGYVFKGEKQS
jgi:copper chaperone CopZ